MRSTWVEAEQPTVSFPPLPVEQLHWVASARLAVTCDQRQALLCSFASVHPAMRYVLSGALLGAEVRALVAAVRGQSENFRRAALQTLVNPKSAPLHLLHARTVEPHPREVCNFVPEKDAGRSGNTLDCAHVAG